ncbi:MAG: hypothetical protein IJ637_02090 [Prevotella sp.]|nr:hypothetical protein [Prevotella sp.]
MMKNTVVMAVVMLLTSTVALAANQVTIIKNGKGNATSDVSNGVCTLTVTPGSGEYAKAENITVIKTVSGDVAQAPLRRSPGIDNETITVTPSDMNGEPSGETTYTFTMPGDDYDVEVTVNFQTLKAITPTVTLQGWTYGSDANTPTVTGNTGNGDVTYTYAAAGETNFTEDVPTDAGTYTVKATIATKGEYAAGEATATFTIAQKALTDDMVTLSATTFEYSGEDQQPDVTVEDGENQLSDDDYEQSVSGDSQTAVGTYTITVTGKGNYTGTVTKSYEIVNRTLTEGKDVTFASGQTWATFYNTEETLSLPAGINAYIAASISGTTINLQAIENVPQNVPVLLEKSETKPAEYAESTKDNLLQGTAESTMVSRISGGTVYVLYNGMFVKSESGTIPANKAYLQLTAVAEGSAPMFLMFNVETTGVQQAVSAQRVAGGYYNLNGQRINSPAKGIYIQNGKKFVVK